MEYAQHARAGAVLSDAPSVSVVVRREGRDVVVLVHGDADAHTSEDLRSSLMSILEDAPRSVRVDLGDLSFCGLAGSDALHAFADEATAHEIPVDFDGMSPLLRTLFTRFPPRRSSRGRDGQLPDSVDG